MKVEVVNIAVIGNNKPAEGTKETNQERLDCESLVAITSDIVKAMDEIIKLGETLRSAKIAHKKATERIDSLTKEIERSREEALKADAAVKLSEEDIIKLQAFLKEKGIKI